MPTLALPSLWHQAWQWATSPVMRAEHRAEHAFWQLLATGSPEQLADAQALSAALQGAAPDLVNRALPAAFGPPGQPDRPGLPPLMWALLSRHWALATHLLDHGADPTVLIDEEVVRYHVQHLPPAPSYQESLGAWPRALLSPLTVAVLLADKVWEGEQQQRVHDAWVDNPWSRRHEPAFLLDQHASLGPLLSALFAREALPWTLPQACHSDPEVRADSATVRLLVAQGSTLMAWPDAWLQRMNLSWSNRNGGLISAAVRGCFASRYQDLDRLPALDRLLDLGVDPQCSASTWRQNPVREMVYGVTSGPLKPSALLRYAFDERFDWDARDHHGRTAWAALSANADSKNEWPQQQQDIKDLVNNVHTRRVEQEARELRRTMRQAEQDMAHDARVARDAEGTAPPAPTVARTRPRL